MSTEPQTVRIDKWLWAARFFKTRSLATEAINGGKVHVNGERVKPSRKVGIGDTLEVRQGYDLKTVIVTDLAERRGSATVAAGLYRETEESLAQRLQASEQRRLLASDEPSSDGRPTKKQRRQIHRFKGEHDL